MVFKPNAKSFRAASYLRSFDKCLCDYGRCDLLSNSFELHMSQQKKNHFRSENQGFNMESANDNVDFVLPNTYCYIH